MFAVIKRGDSFLPHRIVRGGQPKTGRILVVQEASDRGLKMRAMRSAKCQRVQVLSMVERDGKLPMLWVTWLKGSDH